MQRKQQQIDEFFQTKIMKLFRSLIFSSKRLNSNLAFVPTHHDPSDQHLEALKTLLNAGEKPNKGDYSSLKINEIRIFVIFFFLTVLVVTGAGISTESGLQDYRSEDVGLYARSDKRPTNHMTFVKNPNARKSYWARNFVGWDSWSQTQPNPAHVALAKWERHGDLFRPQLTHVITQNVDQLHFKAGSSKVIELHGTLSIGNFSQALLYERTPL